jgi:hypothetical protein
VHVTIPDICKVYDGLCLCHGGKAVMCLRGREIDQGMKGALLSLGGLGGARESTQGSSARISADGIYRYSLSRRWGPGEPLLFVMLNPSTADHTEDDPTIRRCTAFARREGAEGIHVVNLFAFRATKPKALRTTSDPVGPENAAAFRELCEWPHPPGSELPQIVLAWGNLDKRLAGQRETALGWLRGHEDRFRCLGTTKSGDPRHPLFVRGNQPLLRWTHP